MTYIKNLAYSLYVLFGRDSFVLSVVINRSGRLCMWRKLFTDLDICDSTVDRDVVMEEIKNMVMVFSIVTNVFLRLIVFNGPTVSMEIN